MYPKQGIIYTVTVTETTTPPIPQQGKAYSENLATIRKIDLVKRLTCTISESDSAFSLELDVRKLLDARIINKEIANRFANMKFSNLIDMKIKAYLKENAIMLPMNEVGCNSYNSIRQQLGL
ncbi:hypothetical protein A9Q91_01205 [Candidatus Gracilibacteria bacterium 28_42_T64]|nr:hypothetical protein A9Q91_01205 [Candidatus Gracilibacteria bacterium 28_42_T64]